MTRYEAFADLKKSLAKETEDIVYRCKDCSKYNLCRYYHRRKETSQICHYFELPERKTGKWKIYVISMLDGEGCRCSECGFEGAPYWHYCPDCGAKIEGVCKEER